MSKSSEEMTREEWNDVLDCLYEGVRQHVNSHFSDRVEFALILGKQDYRGMVTSIPESKDVPYLLRRAADLIEGGQTEWSIVKKENVK